MRLEASFRRTLVRVDELDVGRAGEVVVQRLLEDVLGDAEVCSVAMSVTHANDAGWAV